MAFIKKSGPELKLMREVGCKKWRKSFEKEEKKGKHRPRP